MEIPVKIHLEYLHCVGLKILILILHYYCIIFIYSLNKYFFLKKKTLDKTQGVHSTCINHFLE